MKEETQASLQRSIEKASRKLKDLEKAGYCCGSRINVLRNWIEDLEARKNQLKGKKN